MEGYKPRSGDDGFVSEPPSNALQIASDPYVARPGCSPIGQQIQTVLSDLLHHIELGTSLVVVSGAPGTGKTWLLDKTARLCTEKGLSVRREDRGDLIDIALTDTCDVLLVDEADSASPELLEQLMEARGSRKRRHTIVLMCLPGSVMRFDRVGRYPPLLQLLPLADDEAREFLEGGARSIGRSALFIRDAARLMVAQSAGSPRLLRRNASLAYFAAASEGRTVISSEHVSQALEANSFAAAAKNPNEGKSWTKPDPSDHSVLYQKNSPPPPAEIARRTANPISTRSVEILSAKPVQAASDPGSSPSPIQATFEKPAQPNSSGRKLSEFALYSTPGASLRDFAHAIKAEKEEKELEKIKRRESNRIFYHSWRFGK
jgi:hypothetical protein